MRVVRSKDNATTANMIALGGLEVMKLGIDGGLDFRSSNCA